MVVSSVKKVRLFFFVREGRWHIWTLATTGRWDCDPNGAAICLVLHGSHQEIPPKNVSMNIPAPAGSVMGIWRFIDGKILELYGFWIATLDLEHKGTHWKLAMFTWNNAFPVAPVFPNIHQRWAASNWPTGSWYILTEAVPPSDVCWCINYKAHEYYSYMMFYM